MTRDYKRKKIKRTKHFKKRNRLKLQDIVPVLKTGIRGVMIICAVSLVLLLCGYLFSKIKDSSYFHVKKMVFKGCENSKEEDLCKISGVIGEKSLFSIDPMVIAKKISSHPWVKEAGVKKQYPDKLNVYVKEREPVAIVSLDNLYYIDKEGTIFKKLEKEDKTDYLVITGLSEEEAFSDNKDDKDKIFKAIDLIKFLSKRDTFSDKNVSEINLCEDKGITLFTYNEAIPIKVGTQFSKSEFDRLDRVFKELKKKSMKPEYIDIDYDKRVVVKVAAKI